MRTGTKHVGREGQEAPENRWGGEQEAIVDNMVGKKGQESVGCTNGKGMDGPCGHTPGETQEHTLGKEGQ